MKSGSLYNMHVSILDQFGCRYTDKCLIKTNSYSSFIEISIHEYKNFFNQNWSRIRNLQMYIEKQIVRWTNCINLQTQSWNFQMFPIQRTNILLRELRNLSRGTVNAEIRERCSKGKKNKKTKPKYIIWFLWEVEKYIRIVLLSFSL